jgi:hypothetical protein
MSKPLCLSCRFFVYKHGIVGKVKREWPACEKEVAGFPGMTRCVNYERAPGSDDE